MSDENEESGSEQMWEPDPEEWDDPEEFMQEQMEMMRGDGNGTQDFNPTRGQKVLFLITYLFASVLAVGPVIVAWIVGGFEPALIAGVAVFLWFRFVA